MSAYSVNKVSNVAYVISLKCGWDEACCQPASRCCLEASSLPEQKCFDFSMCELAWPRYGASVALVLSIDAKPMLSLLLTGPSDSSCNVSKTEHLSESEA